MNLGKALDQKEAIELGDSMVKIAKNLDFDEKAEFLILTSDAMFDTHNDELKYLTLALCWKLSHEPYLGDRDTLKHTLEAIMQMVSKAERADA